MTENTCKTCRFREPIWAREPDGTMRELVGNCHRKPPAWAHPKWPSVLPSDWCGEHKPLVVPETRGAAEVEVEVAMEATYCATCSIPFCLPASYLDNARNNGATFYCPNGHSLSYY